MNTVAAVRIPWRIESVANQRWHWAKKATYMRQSRLQTWAELRRLGPPPALASKIVVKLVRIAPRALDGHDNLRSGFKGVVDGVADWLKVPDNDPRLEWQYEQRQGPVKTYAVLVEVCVE